MIESISINNVASYQNECKIDLLKKVNFFFGHNGSGKSTLAKYLYNLSLPDAEKNQAFNNCSQNGYDNAKHQILVYNEDFVHRNFIQQDIQSGIFSLNNTNEVIDKQIKVEETKQNNYKYIIETTLKNRTNILNSRKDKEYTDLREFCWNKRNKFSGFTKLSLKYSGSKDNNLNYIINTVLPNIQIPHNFDDLQEEYKRLYEFELIKVEKKIKRSLYKEIRICEEIINNQLSEVIVGNDDLDIAKLIKELGNSSWIEEGLKYVERTQSKCPFCQNETIDKILLQKFERYFDEEYKRKVNAIIENRNIYERLKVNLLSDLRHIQNQYNKNSLLSDLYIEVDSFLSNNLKIINEKILKPNERKEIVSLSTLKSKLSSVNRNIKENNFSFDNISKDRNKLTNNVWNYITNKCSNEISTYNDRLKKAEHISKLIYDLNVLFHEKVNLCRNEIEKLQGQTVNTKDAVDNINLILKNAGFDNFEIAERGEKINNISQYYLKRCDSTEEYIFKTLSEGEKNFIAFLYFYQLCIGTNDITNKGLKKIIIIDDPVSSLDSRCLFILVSLVHTLVSYDKENNGNKKELKNSSINQIFLLTHNTYFYKEVSLKYRPICTDRNHFQVQKLKGVSSIIEVHERNLIQDDYSLLWKSLIELKRKLETLDKSWNILIANNMRRILESFATFNGFGNDAWAAIKDISSNTPDVIMYNTFLSSINNDSHSAFPMDSFYYQSITNSEPETLFEIFERIFQKIGFDHYYMMIRKFS